jgi:molybdopterin molybdotransferase
MIAFMPGFQTDRADDPLLAVEEAQRRVLDEAVLVDIERVALDAAHGRVLREDVEGIDDAPPFDNSAMDGYAVRAGDIAAVPVALRVLGDVPAGVLPDRRVTAGTAMRIMTGGWLPEGADTVVQVELTDGGTDSVTVHRSLKKGSNVRLRGDDVRRGEVVLRSGTRIGPAEIAMLAANRKVDVGVSRRPQVAILSTGDELADVSAEPVRGKIVNTNEWLLAALVREVGAVPRALGIVRDSREATIAALERAAESDVVVTTGGVSVGAFDFVKDALDALGAETKFWRVAMKPGKPVVLSRLRDRLSFGLPGNPASAFVSFHLFVAPAIRKMLGIADPLPPLVDVKLGAPLRAAPDRRVYFRARVTAVDRELVAHPLKTQGSGSLTSMLGANALVMLEAGSSAEAGSRVPAVLLNR